MKLWSILGLNIVFFLSACSHNPSASCPCQLAQDLTPPLKALYEIVRDDGSKKDFYQGLTAAHGVSKITLGHVEDDGESTKFIAHNPTQSARIIKFFNQTRQHLAKILAMHLGGPSLAVNWQADEVIPTARFLRDVFNSPRENFLQPAALAEMLKAQQGGPDAAFPTYVDPLVLQFVEQNLAQLTVYLGILLQENGRPSYPLAPTKAERQDAATNLANEIRTLQEILSSSTGGFAKFGQDAAVKKSRQNLQALVQRYYRNKASLKFKTYDQVLMANAFFAGNFAKNENPGPQDWYLVSFAQEKMLQATLDALLGPSKK